MRSRSSRSRGISCADKVRKCIAVNRATSAAACCCRWRPVAVSRTGRWRRSNGSGTRSTNPLRLSWSRRRLTYDRSNPECSASSAIDASPVSRRPVRMRDIGPVMPTGRRLRDNAVSCWLMICAMRRNGESSGCTSRALRLGLGTKAVASIVDFVGRGLCVVAGPPLRLTGTLHPCKIRVNTHNS
jgi:hypothetical protein